MTETVSRREANKARTRAALVAAVYDIIESDGVDALTAERVADAAGISRRTFFNYFSSVDAVVAAGGDEILDQVRAALAARPDAEPLTDSAIAVIEGLFTVDLLAESTRAWRAVEQVPAARRYALEASSDQITAMAHDWARSRLDAAGDPLRVSVLMATTVTAFDEARRHWLATHDGEVDEQSLAEFLAVVRRALDMVRPALG